MELLNFFKVLLKLINTLKEAFFLLLQLGHEDDFLVLDHIAAIGEKCAHLHWPALLRPESLDVLLNIFK